MASADLVADLLPLLGPLRQAPDHQMWTWYDAEADVLYVNFRQPSEADDAELGDDNVIRRYAADGELIGVTVLNASERTA